MTVAGSEKSTTVRPRPPRKLRFIRSSFAALEPVAPGMGGRWAERLWFTVPNGRRPAPRGGSGFEVRTQGRIVRGWVWGDGPVVYLVHGWGGNAGQFDAFVQPLATAGFTVVAHDAPSHGSSGPGHLGPRASTIYESAQSLDAVAARYGPAHAVVSHSLGSMAAALASARGWLGTRRWVMVAPMVNVADAASVFAGRLRLGRRTRERMVRRIERRLGESFDLFDIDRLLDPADRPPLLAIHDRDDQETSYAATEALVAGWPDGELVSTRGLGHRRILRDPDVVRTVTSTLVADLEGTLSRPA
jgi:pimeloyl-ACP methyl ester carboxylesterase